MEMYNQSTANGSKANVAMAIKQVFVNVFGMYYRAHAFHWNVKGVEFSQFHDFFAEIYEDVYGSVDPLAENIRKMGFDAPIDLHEICAMTQINMQDVTSSNPMDMTASLLEANQVVTTSLNIAFSIATACNEQGVANFVGERIDAHNKWEWQLSTTLGKDDRGQLGKSQADAPINATPIEVVDYQPENSEVEPVGDMEMPGMIQFSNATELTLNSKVKEHNDIAPNGRKASLEMLKAVYRRGASSFSNSNRQDLSRDDWAMSRVSSYLRLLRTGAPVSLSYTQDNDLLPSAHPKAIKEATMTASAAIAAELSLALKEEYEYASPEHAIVAFAEFSGLGYESVPVFRAAWKRAVVKNENPFNRAKELAVEMYSSKDADLLPKKK